MHAPSSTLLCIAFIALGSLVDFVSASHSFSLQNKCSYAVPVLINNWANTKYTGPQPGTLAPGQLSKVTLPDGWNGRICHSVGGCSNSCYGTCSMTEFNLDTGSIYTPQAYDISNIQGFTVPQAIIPADKTCESVQCTSANCACSQAYPIGDESGCGDDDPVKACGAGDKAFDIVYCPTSDDTPAPAPASSPAPAPSSSPHPAPSSSPHPAPASSPAPAPASSPAPAPTSSSTSAPRRCPPATRSLNGPLAS